MNWYRNLYVGKTFQKNREEIIRLAEADKPVSNLYLIVLRKDKTNNQLEIVSQHFLKGYFSDADAVLITGIAFGMTEAKELLWQMTDRVYRETGTAELKKYFLSH